MKTLTCNIVFALFFVAASAVFGAGMPTMDVTVSDSQGHLAYRGTTSNNGTFATGELSPGKYVVEFKARNSAVNEDSLALVVSAGKQKVVAQAVDGDKFLDGGVAMRVKVGRGLNITGQVAAEDANGVASVGNEKIKVVNGHHYVWIEDETGSHMGGHWVEMGTSRNWNVVQLRTDEVQDLQERGSQNATTPK